MREQLERAPYNLTIKKLNICSIPLSVGLEKDIYKFFRCLPSSGFKLYDAAWSAYISIQCRLLKWYLHQPLLIL